MKKVIAAMITIFMVVSLMACSSTTEKSVLDKIKESPIAKLELPDGNSMYVDGEIASLHTFADLDLMESTMEPADEEADWIYRITFNPSDRVKDCEEIVVSVHKEYVQINSEFYLTSQGVPFSDIIDWTKSKFDMFMQ